MNKEYKKRSDENFAQWIERIAAACQGKSLEEVREMITEVCKQGYIKGVQSGRKFSGTLKGMIKLDKP